MTPREKLILEFIAEAEFEYKRVMPDSLQQKWLHAFDDIHLDRLGRAMKRVADESNFFPRRAEIRAAAKQLPANADEIAEIEQRRREREQRLLRGIELANKRQLEAPIRSLLDPPVEAPKPEGMTTRGPMSEAEYDARVAELQRQKVEALRIEAWGKEVTKHAKPIERGVTGAEAEFLLYDPGAGGLVM
jgi:hypothetical protein